MKFIASIFLLLVGFLIIQPAIGSNQKTQTPKAGCMRMEGMCCKKKCKKESKEQSNNDCNKCNPFMPCAYGNFFVNQLPFQQQSESTEISTKKYLSEVKIISSYVSACWHPPEL